MGNQHQDEAQEWLIDSTDIMSKVENAEKQCHELSWQDDEKHWSRRARHMRWARNEYHLIMKEGIDLFFGTLDDGDAEVAIEIRAQLGVMVENLTIRGGE